MLFDLRGRGRRRTVQVIYVGLALLMAGGLIGFGIGGATSGGLLDAFKGGGGGGSTSDVFKKQIQRAEQNVKLQPRSAAAWTALARARYQEASSIGYNDSTGQFTDKGQAAMVAADHAWQRALTLTDNPDPNVAATMVQLYSPGALNQPAKAVRAFEVQLAGTADPTWQLYAKYSQLAYLAKQDRKGELAGQKAVRKAPKDQKAEARQAVAAAKQQAQQQAQQEAAQQTGAATGAG